MKRTTALRHNLNRVVNHVQANCGTSINLEQMADIACLSKFHFTRVFQNYIHASPYHYLYRTRLEFAARCLTYQPGKSITSIAMESGFSDAQSFSKAFRQRYQMSPSVFRSDGSLLGRQAFPVNPRQNPLAADHVDIVNRPAMRLAYIRNLGPYLDVDSKITRTCHRIIDWAKQQKLWSADTACIGLVPSNPMLTPPEACIYDASIEVPDEIEEDEIVSIQTIPSGRYAVFRLACETKQLRDVWNWIGFEWLPTTGETYAMEHSYEILRPGPLGIISPQNGIELYMKLQPR